MPRHSDLPTSLAPRLINRVQAAAYSCVSPNTFDKMVADGTMPPPRKVSAIRLAWDVRELDAAIDALPHRGGDEASEDDGWDDAPQAAA